MATRYITVPALQIKETIIPIWDETIEFIEDGYFGDYFRFDGKKTKLIMAVYDTQDKKLIGGVEVDNYQEKTEFWVGEEIYHEVKSRVLVKSRISTITYESFDMKVCKGSDLEDYYKNKIEKFNPETIYVIKDWKPTYNCEDGFKTVWTYQIYKKG